MSSTPNRTSDDFISRRDSGYLNFMLIGNHEAMSFFSNPRVSLNNGLMFTIHFTNIECKTNNLVKGLCFVGLVTVDTNGNKKPNTWGYDGFAFKLSDDGRLIPVGSRLYAFSKVADGTTEEDALATQYYWNYFNNGTKTSQYNCRKDNNKSAGIGCAARIIENGWKIDY